MFGISEPSTVASICVDFFKIADLFEFLCHAGDATERKNVCSKTQPIAFGSDPQQLSL